MTLSQQAVDFLSRRQPNGKQKDFFDSHADIWDEINHNDLSKLEYICGLLDLKGSEHLMDVGTGTGVMIPYYLERIPAGHVTAVDFSEAMIEQAALKNPPSDQLDYKVSDVCDLEPNGDFDVVVCYSCFPHFPDPRAALRSMSGVLRKGGRLMIAHSSSKDFINDVHRHGGEEISKDFLPPAEIMTELLDEQGLRSVFARDDEKYYIVIAEKVRCNNASIFRRILHNLHKNGGH